MKYDLTEEELIKISKDTGKTIDEIKEIERSI